MNLWRAGPCPFVHSLHEDLLATGGLQGIVLGAGSTEMNKHDENLSARDLRQLPQGRGAAVTKEAAGGGKKQPAQLVLEKPWSLRAHRQPSKQVGLGREGCLSSPFSLSAPVQDRPLFKTFLGTP